MKVKVREVPKVFDAEQIVVEHLLDPKNHPLPAGVKLKGRVEIFPEQPVDEHDEPSGEKRKPHERLGSYNLSLDTREGSKRVSVGDWILTDANGDKKVIFKDNFDTAFQKLEAEPKPPTKAEPVKASGKSAKAE